MLEDNDSTGIEEIPDSDLPTSIDPALMGALFEAESSNDPYAVGPVTSSGEQARGIGQIMPKTWDQYADPGMDIFNEEDNKEVSRRILEDYTDQFGGDTELGLAAYNMGPGKLQEYIDQTPNGTWEEVKELLDSRGAYAETSAYVPKIMGKYEKAKGTSAPQDSSVAGFNNSNNAAPVPPPQFETFEENIAYQISLPEYDKLSTEERLKNLSDIYQSKDWGEGADETLREVSTFVWQHAKPEEQADYMKLIGSPPMIPEGENVEEEMQKWRWSKIDEVNESGLNPDLLGNQFYDTLKAEADKEIEAYNIRNRSTVSRAFNRAGNLARNLTKGLADIPAIPIAGAVRTIGSAIGDPEEAAQQADYIQSLPDLILGEPDKDFTYVTDKNGRYVTNEDGTLKRRWEYDAARTFSSIAGSLAGTVATAELGVPMAAILTTQATGFSFSLANDTFNQVYELTGDREKAFQATMFTIPAGVVGTFAGYGILGRVLTPSLNSLNTADVRRFVAKSMIGQGALGAVSGVGAVGIQQAGEEAITGEGYNPEELKQAALIGGVSAGLVGAGFGYATKVVPAKQAFARMQRVELELVNFRYDIKPEAISSVKPEDVVPGLANEYGVDVSTDPKGNAIFTKKTDLVFTGQEDIGTLLNLLEAKKTPNEIEYYSERVQELVRQAEKTPAEQAEFENLTNILLEHSDPVYQNNIKAIEYEIYKKLQESPDSLPVRWNEEGKYWLNYDTDKKANFLKEALGKEDEAAQFDVDVSDVSNIKIYDEDTAIDVTPVKRASGETLRSQLKAIDEELDAIKLYKTDEPDKAVREESAKLQTRLEKVDADILEWKNALDETGDKGEIEQINSLLNDLVKEQRQLKADLLRNKETVRKEKATEKDFKDSEKTALARTKLEKRREQLQNRLKLVEETEKAQTQERVEKEKARIKGELAGQLGAFVRKGDVSEVYLSKNLSPEARSQVLAHEYGHSVEYNLKLPKEVKDAVDARIEELRDLVDQSELEEIVAKIVLPEVINNLQIKGVPLSKLLKQELTPNTEKALFSRREFVTNQIAAIMAKRAGRDIGGVEILPEIASFLERTKLPKYPIEQKVYDDFTEDFMVSELGGRKKAAEAKKAAARKAAEATMRSNRGKQKTPPPPPPKDPPVYKTRKTGNIQETAWSMYQRTYLPNLDPVLYAEVSRDRSILKANNWVKKYGLDAAFKLLEEDNGSLGSVSARASLADAAWRQAAEINLKNPSELNEYNFNKAGQIRAAVLTEPAQALAIVQRFRNMDTFTDFMLLVSDTYRKSGSKQPKFTDYMRAELEAAYNQTKKVPNGIMRDNATFQLYNKAMQFQDTPTSQLIAKYFRFDLLSGAGTPVINFAGGAWMGAVFTAMSHPVAGKGLVWRAMFNAVPTGYHEALRIMKGKITTDLLGGMNDIMPVDVGIAQDASAGKRYLGQFLNKFGNKWLRPLYASDAFFRRLAFEGYTSIEQFKRLNEQFPNNPEKVAAKVAEYLLPNQAREGAIKQATEEYRAANIPASDADIKVRAYEILRMDQLPADLIEMGNTWADLVSLRGDVSHTIPAVFDKAANFLGAKHPAIKAVVLPFSRSMARLSDFALDFIPGIEILDPNVTAPIKRKVFGKSDAEPVKLTLKQQVARQRAIAGRNVGLGLSISFLSAALEGLIEITGEEGDVLTATGEEGEGKAKSRKEFKEFAQKGVDAYSVYLKGSDIGFKYKDFPGLSSILLGVHKFKKAIDKGQTVSAATFQFYVSAFKQAVPFFSDQTLSGPYQSAFKKFMEAEGINERSWAAAQDVLNSVSRMAIPFSSALSDAKKMYDSTPEETVQDWGVNLLKNIPGISEAIGSKPAIDRFGESETRTLIDSTPGISRILAQKKEKSDKVWKALAARDLVIPELPKRYEFRKKDFVNEYEQEKYQASREERISKAATNTFTPDEWYKFIQVTGPQIKRVAAELVTSSAPDIDVQLEIIKRVRKIEDQARKNYVRYGKF